MNDTFRIALRAMVMAAMTLLTVSTATAQVKVHGNVYGGGNLADVKVNTRVNMSAGTVAGNVFGGGKGKDDTFTCEKAMVGVEGEGAGQVLDSDDNKDKGTIVTISNGTVGTLEGEEGSRTLKEGTGNVYGGGEIGRVEWNTQVKIGVGTGNGSFAPTIYGNVFGAGKGLKTHGYSALVRGNSAVTIQGGAKIGENVYGGGEMSTVGRYWVKGINDNVENAPEAPSDLPDGMPYQKQSGGICRVTIQGNAEIGTNGTDDKGHVFGAGKGVDSRFVASGQEASKKMIGTNELVPFTATADKTAEQLYYEFLQTLALVTETYVTIDGSAQVKGSAFGGSESGFVQTNTDVKIQGSGCVIGTTTYGNVFGGGKGLEYFAEAGKVKGNTVVAVSAGTIKGNIYGGGRLGDVGTIDKTNKNDKGELTYNYFWKQSNGTTANVGEHNTNATADNTGICTVSITGGTIGLESTNEPTKHGNVFGAGRGLDDTFWCEKAIAYATAVSITGGTVYGNVYGGGQIGRVEDDAKVTIGGASTEARADIKGSIFGAGAGKETHGYSALVRGDTKVNVEGYAQVGGSVYGGGETASVGRYGLNVQKMPNILVGGGKCELTVQGNAVIGENVFGACKGVTPAYNNTAGDDNRSKRMVTYDPNREENPHSDTNKGTFWDPYDDEDNPTFVWEYFTTPEAYSTYLETLALATHPEVTIGGSATVSGSVFGGGELGLTKGSVIVNIQGGTVEEDVYGGGALADTNTTEKVANNYPTTTPETGTDGNIVTKDVYPTTTVNLTGGLIKGDAYGGGLGRLAADAVVAVPATVHGDIYVNLGSSVEGSSATGFYITKYTGDHSDVIKSGRIFGCNNLNGSPQGDVRVTVWKTVKGNSERTAQDNLKNADATHSYNVAAVYGGGNLANYTPTVTGKKAFVRIETCDVSIESVYGGGNAAKAPETNVLVRGAYEINEVFGGGNGKDPYTLNGTDWIDNSGADVNGNATTLLTGGLVHGAYGGSNKRGTIFGNVSIDTGTGSADDNTNGLCAIDVEKIVGAGKDADVNGDLIMVMGCKPDEKIPVVYAGADNANVNGDVMLTITSGKFGKVFGGNNAGGYILGRIRLNIEETADCDPAVPIEIDELYLGGNEAEYSMYGYYNDGAADAPVYKSRTAAMAAITDPNAEGYTPAVTTMAGMDVRKTAPYAKPELNIISCTKIDKVYGGGYGAGATLYGDPIVNINMIPGKHTNSVSSKMTELGLTDNSDKLGIIGDVFGGGNAAKIEGNTTVNIGTATTVNLTSILDDDTTEDVDESHASVKGAYIVGNVYGGGNEADVTGNTFVNICAKKETDGTYTSVAFAGSSGVKITSKTVDGEKVGGNVYGGGKGVADNFLCNKAMIGINDAGADKEKYPDGYPDGNTNVIIGNGTVNGSVYGGGEVGRVEMNTTVTIGLAGTTTSNPDIKGNVFGGGKGDEEHGYAALVRGNPTVTIQANAKVEHNVYGGGEIASVARYKVPRTDEDVAAAIAEGYTDAVKGRPYALKDVNSGFCTVNVLGNAVIGPDTPMEMYHKVNDVIPDDDTPDDAGHVFGAGKGILPKNYAYDSNEVGHKPRSRNNEDGWDWFGNVNEYITFIKTLALSSQTTVTIGDENDSNCNPFVKGSVYGGSENGIVQFDTNVNIKSGQIGCGKNANAPYEDGVWVDGYEPTEDLECASWDYGMDTNNDGKKDLFAPYDPNANATGDLDKYPKVDAQSEAQSTKGGRRIATDGHTYYGNVFGGGSGSVPYFDTANGVSQYIMSAGWVKGNTNVTISGGHILTNVYGGNEATNVDGTATVKMTGGTIGVPRTLAQIDAHPVTCYLFGAGKGDQRVLFNKDTNVKDVVVNITGGRIYGSVFGGGEDGHVLRDVTMTIGNDDGAGPTIGTWGTSYVDGNVFGGGRGFGGDAYTAGNVAGSVKMEIKGGTMLGSIYGGGRLGSVGYGLFDEETNGQPTPGYGEMRDDTDTEDGFTDGTPNFFTHGRGHIDITISGGTIGNTHEYIVPNATNIAAAGISETDISKWTTDNEWKTWKTYHHIPKTEFDTSTGRLTHTKGGNVFAGGMGRFYQLDGTTPISVIDWWKLGNVKSTKLTITGGNIKSNVYGGGEQGWTSGTHTATIDGAEKAVSTEVSVTGGTIGTEVAEAVTTGTGSEATTSNIVRYTYGSVFGGGYGSSIEKLMAGSKETNPKFQAGRVKYSTKVDISGDAKVLASVYGGGEVASVGYGFYSYHEDNVIGEKPLSSASEAANTYVSISGDAVIGKDKDETNNIYYGGATMGNVYGGGSGNRTIVRCGLILGNTNVNVKGGTIYHNIYGGGAYGSVGDFEYETQEDPVQHTMKVYGVKKLHTTGTGTANVTITGGTIGVDGRENGMVFGSSRGDVLGNMQRDDYMAWVNEANVTIGTSGDTTPWPKIAGSVYGSGENGHTLHNTNVAIHSGTIGILTDSPVTGSSGKEYNGAEYPYRGNVYGGGCGTDTYTDDDGKTRYNPLAGIVMGNATVTMDGGRVARTIYGGGAMGSVGTFTYADATYHTEHTDVPLGKPYSCTEGTGLCTVTISGGSVGPDVLAMPNNYGNVFGAGRGEVHDPAEYANLETSGYVNKTLVTVSGSAFVRGSVYGGAESGHVLADTHVKIEDGQIGCGKNRNEPYSDNDWKSTSLDPCVSWDYEEDGWAYDPNASALVDGDWKYADRTTSTEGGAAVATDGHTFYGNVFGGGSGYFPYMNGKGVSKWVLSAGRVEGNTVVTITGGHILTNVYGGNECTDVLGSSTVNMSGGTVGVPRTKAEILQNPALGYLFGAGKGDKRVLFNTWTNVASTSVNVTGGTIYGSVYGGGEDGHVLGDAVTTINQSSTEHPTVIGVTGESGYDGNVFGGGQGSTSALTAGVVGGNVDLKIQNGQLYGSVYGGGRLASVGTYFTDPNDSNYGSLWTTEPEKHGNISVSLTGGTVTQNVFGGGMGTTDDKFGTAAGLGVSRNVTVDLNKDVPDDAKGCVVDGSIFGCNNLNSSPKGHVKVHVHATQNAGASQINDKVSDRYDVLAVYGGGNMAAYEPVDLTTGKTEVIIDGCGLTSIRQVYGGGNAASTPATDVTVNGTYEIFELFGGGNGADDLPDGSPNPGANVGYKDYHLVEDQFPTKEDRVSGDAFAEYRYGTGVAAVTIMGGTVHRVFGGSNTKGNVRQTALTLLEEGSSCPFCVDEAYGGGKSAPMDAEAKIHMACIPGLKAAYGGAEAADIQGDVTLNITNGTFERVFGGNNISGTIRGSITVNIEETGCKPIIIGELYGGGNQAGYSVRGYKKVTEGTSEIWKPRMPEDDLEADMKGKTFQDPQVNIKSFTSIGEVYGGGYGEGAVMVGSPTVNINVTADGTTEAQTYTITKTVDNKTVTVYASDFDEETITIDEGKPSEHQVTRPSHVKGKVGAINNVFGGGNAAKVVGDTHVNIGTKDKVIFETPTTIIETTQNEQSENVTTERPTTEAERTKDVVGADIRGNVYGGGNEAEVTGRTNVTIGKEKVTTP